LRPYALPPFPTRRSSDLVSCEQVSNLLTKVLERGRLMGYLEQSTRYVSYGDKPGGRYRYYHDPDLVDGPHGRRYALAMDGLFDADRKSTRLNSSHGSISY